MHPTTIIMLLATACLRPTQPGPAWHPDQPAADRQDRPAAAPSQATQGTPQVQPPHPGADRPSTDAHAWPDVRLLPMPESSPSLPGVVVAERAVTLGASLDTQVLEVLAQEGQRVRANEPIVRLDDRVARASLDLAQHEAQQTARVQRARLAVEQAQRVLGRLEQAFERGAATEEEVASARIQAQIAQAEHREAVEESTAAALRLQQAKAQAERYTLRAPFEAVVLRVHVEEGAVVRTGDPIAELADVHDLRVDLFLPASTAAAIAVGQRYALAFGEPTDRVYFGVVRTIEPRIEPTSGTVRVRFDLPLARGLVLAGTLATPASRLPTQAELAEAIGNARQGVLATFTDAIDPAVEDAGTR
ncbi:MAG: hypothetical protein KatS3mg103_0212 [Phycisphaerales bacterium]|nr:MAG: hypothetical protein KatS3mg103_0212 [Phycisphaerales bacterium]